MNTSDVSVVASVETRQFIEALNRLREAMLRAMPTILRLSYAFDYAPFFLNLAPSADLLRLVETRWPA